MKNFLIDLLAFAALFSSVLVITSKNPVIAVIFLISVFVNAAGYLILIGIGFIGISYIIVYVGAIAVLFLFVIMLLNIKLTDILETSHQYTKNLPLALAIGLLFIYEIYTIAPFPLNNVSFTSYFLNIINIFNELLLTNNFNSDSVVFMAFSPVIADTSLTTFLQIEAIGQGLYTYGAVWLIVISIILLLAMIAPIFISKNKKKGNSLNHPLYLTQINNLCEKDVTKNCFIRLDSNKLNKIEGKRHYHSSSTSPIDKSALQPKITKLNPWLVTGFTDAEGCFSARLRNYKNIKMYIAPVFSFHMHNNDLEILYSIKDFFGVGTVRTDKTGVFYQVTGLDNLQIILNHFKYYPLQSSKKYSLIIFSYILDILHKKEHLTNVGFLRAVSYINCLNKPIKEDFLNKIIKMFGPIPILALPPVAIISSINIINPYWIVGFIMGDGGFTFSKSVTISKKTGETRISFSMQMFVSQLNTDIYLLKSIANHIGTGLIRSYPKYSVTNLLVSDLKSIQHLILPFFHKYPLLGHKKIQYNLWLKAVFINIGTPGYSKIKQKEIILALIKLSNLQSRSKDKNKLTRFLTSTNYPK